MATKSFRPFAVLGLYTETSLHCGTEASLGYVDLPIQREAHTGNPVIPGSTLKGRLRDELLSLDGKVHRQVFGAEKDPDSTGDVDVTLPGSVSFGDGKLVAFPIRSSGSPFYWVTSCSLLEGVFRALGVDAPLESPATGTAWGAETRDSVLLEEMELGVVSSPALFEGEAPHVGSLLRLLPRETGFGYTQEQFPKRLLVLREEDLTELLEVGTEVRTRIKLNVLGTTAVISKEDAEARDLGTENLRGNLFVEESVPPDTLFYSILRAADSVEAFDVPPVVQIGGGETIGRGVTHVTSLGVDG